MDVEALSSVVNAIANTCGPEFHEKLCVSVHKAVRADLTAVGRTTSNLTQVETLCCVIGTEVVDNFTYDLEGSPCADLLEGKLTFIRTGAARLYPRDAYIVEGGYDAYVAIPLKRPDGTPIGIFSALFKRSIESDESVIGMRTLMKFFSGRISGEIIRNNREISTRNELRLRQGLFRCLAHELRTPIAYSEEYDSDDFPASAQGLGEYPTSHLKLHAAAHHTEPLAMYRIMYRAEMAIMMYNLLDKNIEWRPRLFHVGSFLRRLERSTDMSEGALRFHCSECVPEWLVSDVHAFTLASGIAIDGLLSICTPTKEDVVLIFDYDLSFEDGILTVVVSVDGCMCKPNIDWSPDFHNWYEVLRDSFSSLSYLELSSLYFHALKGMMEGFGGKLSFFVDKGEAGDARVCLKFSLPAAREKGRLVSHEPQLLDSSSENDISVEMTERPSILVVDDVMVNRKLLTRLLRRAGFAVSEASDGLKAVEFVREHGQPALVLMDVQMPVMNGYEATAEIRKTVRDKVHIVGLSANADLQTCLNSGMDDLIGKPVAPIDLLAIVQQYL